MQYKPKMQINFGKENRFHVYHSEGGERFLTNCTRLNMLFIAGNSILLLLEIISPCKSTMHSTSFSLRLLAWSQLVHDSVFFLCWLLHAQPLLHENDTRHLAPARWQDY